MLREDNFRDYVGDLEKGIYDFDKVMKSISENTTTGLLLSCGKYYLSYTKGYRKATLFDDLLGDIVGAEIEWSDYMNSVDIRRRVDELMSRKGYMLRTKGKSTLCLWVIDPKEMPKVYPADELPKKVVNLTSFDCKDYLYETVASAIHKKVLESMLVDKEIKVSVKEGKVGSFGFSSTLDWAVSMVDPLSCYDAFQLIEDLASISDEEIVSIEGFGVENNLGIPEIAYYLRSKPVWVDPQVKRVERVELKAKYRHRPVNISCDVTLVNANGEAGITDVNIFYTLPIVYTSLKGLDEKEDQNIVKASNALVSAAEELGDVFINVNVLSTDPFDASWAVFIKRRSQRQNAGDRISKFVVGVNSSLSWASLRMGMQKDVYQKLVEICGHTIVSGIAEEGNIQLVHAIGLKEPIDLAVGRNPDDWVRLEFHSIQE